MASRQFQKKKNIESVPHRQVAEPLKSAKSPHQVKGMKDILPVEQKYWEYVRDTARKLSSDYCFERIDTPVVEDVSLYTTAVGKMTDIVEKEMYTLIDLSGNTLALRPEFTAAMARSYIEHGMQSQSQPVKLYSIGPLFRYDKPQEGRYRQHHQFNCEMIGEAKSSVDAQLMFMAHTFFRRLGLKTLLQINSIGCAVCRPEYRDILTEYYRSKRSTLCEDCKRRLTKNPLRLLDCKVDGCQPTKQKAPHLVDYLCEACKDHFLTVLDFIDDFEITYQHNPHLVRGLDYYSRTVFEFVLEREEDEETKSLSLGGGGRWDGLVELFGGQQTPACGFGIGLERVILAMKAREQTESISLLPKIEPPKLFVAQLGDAAKRRAMCLYEELLAEGFHVASEFSKDSLKAQLEIANRLNASFTLILGQKELLDGTVIIRNMEGGEQEVIDSKKLMAILKKKFALQPVEEGEK